MDFRPRLPMALLVPGFAAFFAVLLSAGGAAAASLTAQDLLSGFNNIVLHDLTANAETEGSVFVGGTYSGGATVNPDLLPNVDLGGGILGTFVVGGDVAGNANLQSGNAQIGGSITGSIGNNGGGTINTGVVGLPIEQVRTVLTGLSTDLAALADTGGTANTSDQNNIGFVSQDGGGGIAVFNISASVLSTGTFQGITADTGITTIINVAGINVSIGVNANQTRPDVIFNFFEAQTLSIGSSFNYSILAPLADVALQGGGINGTVVSGSLVQQAEIRPGTFSGQLPPPDTQVPLPAPVLLLLGGLAALGLVGRNRAAV